MIAPDGEPPAIEAQFEGRLGAFQLNVAFTVRGGGVTALVGPSGCGKTTVLRCIAGLTRLRGRLTVLGQVWQDEACFVPTHRRAVGYVFQEPSLLPHLSVRENLLFGFKRRGERRTFAFDAVVDLLDLADLLARSPARLSGGERQRVAIGRALLAQPDVLLMDEPLSSLDADSKAQILPFVAQLHTLSVPVIYVSHDSLEVERLASRSLSMRRGEIIAPSAPNPRR